MGSSRSPYCFTPDSGRVCRGNACLSLTTLERMMPPSAITDSMSARSSRSTEPLGGSARRLIQCPGGSILLARARLVVWLGVPPIEAGEEIDHVRVSLENGHGVVTSAVHPSATRIGPHIRSATRGLATGLVSPSLSACKEEFALDWGDRDPGLL